jgi:signal transduction histidine kinase
VNAQEPKNQSRWGVRYQPARRDLDSLSLGLILAPALTVGLVLLVTDLVRPALPVDWLGAPVRFGVALFAGITMAWLLVRRSAQLVRADHERALQETAEQVALRAMTEERGRLGRELHDGAAQLLAYVLLKVDTVADLLSAGRTLAAERELEQLRETADKTYQEARDAVVDLRTDVVQRGIASSLRTLCDQLGARSDLTVNLHVTPIADRMRPTVQLQAYQIAREALGNVRTHSAANQVWVRVDANGSNAVLLTIRDDGVGFDPAAAHVGKRRFGLHTMRERAESVGGRLAITAQRGQGTSVVAELPLEAPEEEEATEHATPIS